MTCSSYLRPLKQPRKAGNVAPGNPARKIQQGGKETKTRVLHPTSALPVMQWKLPHQEDWRTLEEHLGEGGSTQHQHQLMVPRPSDETFSLLSNHVQQPFYTSCWPACALTWCFFGSGDISCGMNLIGPLICLLDLFVPSGNVSMAISASSLLAWSHSEHCLKIYGVLWLWYYW